MTRPECNHNCVRVKGSCQFCLVLGTFAVCIVLITMKDIFLGGDSIDCH